MKTKHLLCVITILFFFVKAQAQTGNVGIGNNAPTAKLHVTGNARITNMPPGNAADSVVTADVDGNLRKRPASAFGGGTNGPGSAGASLDSIYASSPFGLLVDANRSGDYLYNGGAGWANNVWTDFDFNNERTDPQNTFDVNTNEFTAPATGLYLIQTFVGGNAEPNPALEQADGGNIAIRIQVAQSGGTTWTTIASSELNRVVNRNVSGGLNYFATTATGAAVMRAGDRARVQFLTYGTANFNNWNMNRTGMMIIRVR